MLGQNVSSLKQRQERRLDQMTQDAPNGFPESVQAPEKIFERRKIVNKGNSRRLQR
jgi:hypothetical protein